MLDVGLLEKTLRELKVGKILKDEEGGENEDSSKWKRNSRIPFRFQYKTGTE